MQLSCKTIILLHNSAYLYTEVILYDYKINDNIIYI